MRATVVWPITTFTHNETTTRDVQYAARSGRTCLVITTVGKQRLNFDVYTPDGVVIDLGVFDVPQ